MVSSAFTALDFYQATIDELPQTIVVYEQVGDYDFRVALSSKKLCAALGNVESLVGRTPYDIVSPQEAVKSIELLRQCLDTGQSIVSEQSYTIPMGTVWGRSSYIPLPLPDGDRRFVIISVEDITAQKQREQQEREQQEAIIAQQQATLAELSTPLLAISDTTVVMPIIGTVDSRRVQEIMSTLLSGVAEMQARTVILDITGVPIVDTQVANALLRASQAVKLLGAQIVLTGIRPEVAQTLVGLGVDLAGIITRSSLQSGIAFALTR